MPQSPDKSLASAGGKPAHNIPGGSNYLLVIGIDQYRNGIEPLYNAVNDARAVRDVLWAGYQFDREHTIELFDEQATRSAIIRTFYTLIEQLSSEDNLVLYFSGHGVAHPATGRGFWIPADAIDEDTSTYLNNLEVIDFLRNLKARHVFGIVDSCFSAALFAQRSLGGATRRQYSIPSRWLLTAGRLEPVSDGSLGKHSPFAESLLQQLRYQEEPALWGSDLCGKVLRGVVYNTDKQMPRGEPLQDMGHQGGEFVFLRKGGAPQEMLEDLQRREEPEAMALQDKEKQEGRLSYRDAAGRWMHLDLRELEERGQRELAKLILSKLNYLKEGLIRETDAAVKFKLKYEIGELEEKLRKLV